jgi:hypothetical protein
MSERYWQRPMPLAAALLAAGAVVITGCGSAAGSGADATASATSTAGLAAAAGKDAFTAGQLRDALLGKVNGESPATAAEDGAYSALPDVRQSKSSLQGVTVTPARCAQATVTGFNSGTFADAPASVETFRVGRDGVSEVIVAATATTGAAALAAKLPAGCARYRATVDGKTFSYSVKESTVPGIAEQARALNVKAAGYSDVDVWSVVYRGDGFVGAVTIVGPDASEQGAKVLAEEAYTRAVESLH